MESYEDISKLFYNLRKELDTEIKIHTKPNWKIPQINENSSLGEQIKYYRRLAKIKQSDLCNKLNCDRGVLDVLENREMKLVNINFIKKVLRELNIEDKISINDEYIAFLLDNPSKKIIELRKSFNLTRNAFAELIGVSMTSVKRWENGNGHISREMYKKLKKCMN